MSGAVAWRGSTGRREAWTGLGGAGPGGGGEGDRRLRFKKRSSCSGTSGASTDCAMGSSLDSELAARGTVAGVASSGSAEEVEL